MPVLGFGYALIALTMVIGAHVEYGMVVAVVPAYQLVVFLDLYSDLLMLMAKNT